MSTIATLSYTNWINLITFLTDKGVQFKALSNELTNDGRYIIEIVGMVTQ